MKYLNIKNVLAVWHKSQPLSENDTEMPCLVVLALVLVGAITALGAKRYFKKNKKNMKAIESEELITKMDTLMKDGFPKKYRDVAKLVRGITLSEGLGEHFIYSGETSGRSYRMQLFVLLLNETANLKNDDVLGYKLFREAYIMTDNIYGQLQQFSEYSFVLKDYLTKLEKSLPNRINLFSSEESEEYNNLSSQFTVYRGMCEAEKQSGNYGISWTCDKKRAEMYVFYEKNVVIGTVGYIAEMKIDKNDIFAVWGANNMKKEIVINPTISKTKKNISWHFIKKK